MNRILESYFYVSPFRTTIMSDGREIHMTMAPMGHAAFAGAKRFDSEPEAMEYANWLTHAPILAQHDHDGVKVSVVTRGFYPRKRTPESEAKVLTVLRP